MRNLVFSSTSALALGLALAAPARSASYNFVTLAVPGTMANEYVSVYAVNDLGQAIVNASEMNVSFNYTLVNDLYNLHTNTYTPLPAYPGATTNSTAAIDINNAGEIVGDYHAAGIAWGGFSLSGGSFTPVTYPTGSSYSYPISVSNNGDLTGTWYDGTDSNGYVRIGGAFTELDVPATWGPDTFPDDINTSGTVVGEYFLSNTGGLNDNTEPFLWSGGTFSEGTLPAGYAYGDYSQINDEGVIVGFATNDPANGTDGVSFIDRGGVISQISDPLGVGGTYAYAINNAGVIGGGYVDASGDWQAFLAFPAVPEPSTWAMLAVGFAALGFAGSRRTRTALSVA